ncbi:MAG: rhomboid family intramembrane serine protease [Rhodothermales bacterium]|nr:rhomboid family intramembrane serine protease [Rhodothermales bacterium]MBO6781233.1 rhomboid family intramembrane serine protease [Rhodothermales bacterium]
MLFPIGDDNRGLHRTAYVTITLLVGNLVVYFFLQGSAAFTYGFAAVPLELTTGVDLVSPETLRVQGQSIEIPHAPGPTPIWLTAITAMFMHGGLGHLAGNMLYLWIFGDNVENRFGHRAFLAFYLVSGLAATAAQVALKPSSVIPTLGASGAIAGVLGAYLVLFPRNKVHFLFFLWVISVPALVAIGFWIVTQFVSGWGSITAATEQAGGVAYAAHIGGFVAGVVLATIMRVFIKKERQNVFEVTVHKRGDRMW